jgi:hypothetical protein
LPLAILIHNYCECCVLVFHVLNSPSINLRFDNTELGSLSMFGAGVSVHALAPAFFVA